MNTHMPYGKNAKRNDRFINTWPKDLVTDFPEAFQSKWVKGFFQSRAVKPFVSIWHHSQVACLSVPIFRSHSLSVVVLHLPVFLFRFAGKRLVACEVSFIRLQLWMKTCVFIQHSMGKKRKIGMFSAKYLQITICDLELKVQNEAVWSVKTDTYSVVLCVHQKLGRGGNVSE